MNSNPKLYWAIAAILGGNVTGLAQAEPAADNSSDAIQEITVTAQRRTENMQDVPITIQALTAETLAQLHVSTFDDFIKYLPNVTQASNGPGQSNIFMRGLSAEPGGPGGGGSQGSGTTGQFPNVAVYLDDQSASLPGRNLDIYAADIERIEVLEGPQGTLFGSGAEAGVLRYITNKPKLDVTEGNVNAGYSYTAHGDPNSNVDATINLPLIPDTLAVRAVIYNDSRGGYINNVPSTFTRAGTDEGFAKYNNRRGADRQRGHQQQQHRRQCHQSGDLSGIPAVRALQDQRRLERAADAKLPEHGRAGRVLRDALRFGRRHLQLSWRSHRQPGAAAAVGDRVQSFVRQG